MRRGESGRGRPMPYPFEVDFAEVQRDLDAYVDEVFASLQSEFMTTPKGPGSSRIGYQRQDSSSTSQRRASASETFGSRRGPDRLI